MLMLRMTDDGRWGGQYEVADHDDKNDNNDNDDGDDKEQDEDDNDDNGRGDGIMENRPVSLTLLLGCCSQIEGCPTYDLWDNKKNF